MEVCLICGWPAVWWDVLCRAESLAMQGALCSHQLTGMTTKELSFALKQGTVEGSRFHEYIQSMNALCQGTCMD